MSNSDSFGDRMKRFESASEQVLPEGLPIIIRLDGNSFSNLTDSHFDKPFDRRFEEAMNEAAISVMEYCSGSQVAFIQSDEISILLRNDQSIDFDPFLGNRTQKLASLTASKASVAFNSKLGDFEVDVEAVFDSRCFVVPKHEVVNAFLWRQQDAFRNCINSYAYYGLKEKYGSSKKAHNLLDGKSTDERQEIIFQEIDKNPNDIKVYRKRGRCIYKKTNTVKYGQVMSEEKVEMLFEEGHIDDRHGEIEKSFWHVDESPPMFSSNRKYIKRFIKRDN